MCRRLAQAAGGLVLLLIVGVASLLLLARCEASAALGDPELPPGSGAEGAPNVDANVYVFASFDAPQSLPLSVLGLGGGERAGVVAVEALALDADLRYAARIVLADAESAARFAEASPDAGQWDVRGLSAYYAPEESAWTGSAVAAWESADRVPLPEWDSAAWSALRLLPESPPSPPFAAAVVRRPGDAIASALDAAGLAAPPGLSEGLSLARIGPVAVAAYGDPASLPESEDAPLRPGVSFAAAARSGYPGFIVQRMFAALAASLDMEEVDAGGVSAQATTIEGVRVLAMTRGPVVMLGAAATQEEAEAALLAFLAERSPAP